MRLLCWLIGKARRVNALAARLKELDPEFTVDWTPLPEGR